MEVRRIEVQRAGGRSTDDDASRTEGSSPHWRPPAVEQHARGAAWVTTSPSMETGSSSGLMTLAAGGGYEEKPPQPVEPAAIVAQPGADVYRSGVSVMADFDKMAEMDLHRFLTMPAPRGVTIQCCVQRRRKQNVVQLYLRDETRHLEMGRFLCSAMQKKGKTYVLGATKADVPHKDSPSYQGKLKSNSTGQEFTLYDNGKNPKKMDSWDKDEPGAKGARKKLAAISFEKPADKRLPDARKVSVPAVGEGGVRNYEAPVKLGSMPPKVKPGGKLSLDFGGRVTKISVKNFILHDAKEKPEARVASPPSARGERGLPLPHFALNRGPLRPSSSPPSPSSALLSLVLALRTRHCRTTSGAKPRAPAPRRRVSCCSDVSRRTHSCSTSRTRSARCRPSASGSLLSRSSAAAFHSLAAGGAAARTPTDPGRPLTSRRRRPAHKSDEIAYIPHGVFLFDARPAGHHPRAEWRSGSEGEDRDHAADVLADVGCVREDDVFRVVGPRATCSDHPGAVVLLQHACDCRPAAWHSAR